MARMIALNRSLAMYGRKRATRASELRVGVVLLVLGSLAGCSLLSFKSPEIPLPRRDLNARMLTREYAEQFQTTVAQAADEIAAKSSAPEVQLAALRWKIQAGSASRRAATQMAPMMALLDTWALTAQMREFFTVGKGANAFGDQQAIARDASEKLEQDVTDMARALTSKQEFASYQQFVAGYVRDYPLSGGTFMRASVVDLWTTQTGQQATLLSTLGTVPEAMSDVADRVRLYGDHVPAEAFWQTQLALRETGYDTKDLQQGLKQIDAHLAEIGKLAETSPELIDDAIADTRKSMLELADRFDRSWASMMQTVHEEREALAEDVRVERIAITEAVDVQRAAMMKDAQVIASQVTETSWQHMRALSREFAIYGFVASIVILGLPFVCGYLLGRARLRHS